MEKKEKAIDVRLPPEQKEMLIRATTSLCDSVNSSFSATIIRFYLRLFASKSKGWLSEYEEQLDAFISMNNTVQGQISRINLYGDKATEHTDLIATEIMRVKPNFLIDRSKVVRFVLLLIERDLLVNRNKENIEKLMEIYEVAGLSHKVRK